MNPITCDASGFPRYEAEEDAPFGLQVHQIVETTCREPYSRNSESDPNFIKKDDSCWAVLGFIRIDEHFSVIKH